jgi:hypothetical protein
MHDHAEGTIYRDIDKWRTDKAQRERYPLELEGNFGGIALTNWVYDASRRMLMDLIASYNLSVVNCSDGALIGGATPRVADAVEVDGQAIDRAAVIAEIRRSMVHYGRRQLVPADTMTGLCERSRALFADLRGLLAGFDVDGADFPGVYDAIRKFLDGAGARYAHVDTMIDGSLNALARIAMFYGCRTEAERRQRLFSTFLGELGKVLAKMESRTDELFERLALTIADRAASSAG